MLPFFGMNPKSFIRHLDRFLPNLFIDAVLCAKLFQLLLAGTGGVRNQQNPVRQLQKHLNFIVEGTAQIDDQFVNPLHAGIYQQSDVLLCKNADVVIIFRLGKIKNSRYGVLLPDTLQEQFHILIQLFEYGTYAFPVLREIHRTAGKRLQIQIQTFFPSPALCAA